MYINNETSDSRLFLRDVTLSRSKGGKYMDYPNTALGKRRTLIVHGDNSQSLPETKGEMHKGVFFEGINA
jgi:hypothetical protein